MRSGAKMRVKVIARKEEKSYGNNYAGNWMDKRWLYNDRSYRKEYNTEPNYCINIHIKFNFFSKGFKPVCW